MVLTLLIEGEKVSNWLFLLPTADSKHPSGVVCLSVAHPVQEPTRSISICPQNVCHNAHDTYCT
eukprot:1196331-Prorocentrum_minimum.AAC.2